jgi:hypothetical protein
LHIKNTIEYESRKKSTQNSHHFGYTKTLFYVNDDKTSIKMRNIIGHGMFNCNKKLSVQLVKDDEGCMYYYYYCCDCGER